MNEYISMTFIDVTASVWFISMTNEINEIVYREYIERGSMWNSSWIF